MGAITRALSIEDGYSTEKARVHPQRAVVLCNAEPFGFGPAASLDAVNTHLRAMLKDMPNVSLQYVGSGLTLALHKARSAEHPQGYDQVHDIDVYTTGGPEMVTQLCKKLKPVLFLSVSDQTTANAVLKTDVPVIIIDLLLWYWQPIPTPWRHARQLLVADFKNVRERVEREGLENALIMPPIVPVIVADTAPREGILLNMGGLRNPYIAASEHIEYAQAINDATRHALQRYNEDMQDSASLNVIASPEIVQVLGCEQARTVEPLMAQSLMRSTRLVCMTPGLGNLFEAATCAQQVIILPPANDGQGQQMRFLKEEGLLDDNAIDWHKLIDIKPIEYHKSMLDVLSDIKCAQRMLLDDDQAKIRLIQRIYDEMHRSAQLRPRPMPLRELIGRYGNDGGRMMAIAVMDTLQTILQEDSSSSRDY